MIAGVSADHTRYAATADAIFSRRTVGPTAAARDPGDWTRQRGVTTGAGRMRDVLDLLAAGVRPITQLPGSRAFAA